MSRQATSTRHSTTKRNEREDVLETLGAMLGVVAGVFIIVGVLWRWVVLPNLREQLLKPIRETNRQVTENKHTNAAPTVLDRIHDLEALVEAVGLNQHAILRRLGRHIGESEQDRASLWVIVESLIDERTEGKHSDKRRDS